MNTYVERINTMIGINTGNLIKQIKKEKDFEDFIINKTSFLDSEKNTLAERLFYIRNDITEQRKCRYCGEPIYNFRKNFCSNKCSNKFYANDEKLNKRKGAGGRNWKKNATSEQKKQRYEKTKETNIRLYGTACTLNTPENIKKKKETWNRNYGVDNPNKSTIVTNKTKETCKNKYGGPGVMSSEENRKKREQTYIANYGTTHPMKNADYKKNQELNYFKKTGYKNPGQNPEVIKKQQDTYFKNDGLGKHKKGYRYKIFNTGTKMFRYQGYEGEYLEYVLLKKYNENEIENSVKFMRSLEFIYDYNEITGISHYYVPDFYIEKDNLIIEIKSTYLLNRNFDLILKKAESVTKKGYNFILEHSSDNIKFKKLTYEELKNYKKNN